MSQPAITSEFLAYDRQVRISNSKIGAVLAIILMPAGASLDYFVYPNLLWEFLALRLLCSFFVAVVWMLFHTRFGEKHYRVLGMTWYMLPAFFIAWMIYATGDPTSPYYAGLNIVLLGVGLILPWTYQENLLAGTLVILMYLGACFALGEIASTGLFFNNLYFLVLTTLIVVVGSYFHSRIRYREFELRFELNRNRNLLAENNRKLVEMDEVKNRFFANISHELRTPLTLLLAPLEALLHQNRADLDVQVREWLQIMHANGMRLLKLINDLLDLVRLEAGKLRMRREPVEIENLLRGLVTSIRQVAEDKRVTLSLDVAPEIGVIAADRDKLEKVVLNLLFNAVKFTSAGGRVSVSAKNSAGQFILQVADTGMGIPEKSLPFIFDRFWQADSSSKRKYQGTGIGLALVKELVEAHGGTVSAQSREAEGTTMTVTLPYLESEPPPSVSELSTDPSVDESNGDLALAEDGNEVLAKLYRRAELFPSMSPLHETVRPFESLGTGERPRLLVADDEPDMLRFIKSQLKETYHVYEAVDGLQAIEKASQFLPDVILLDMMMPEKDGLQVCRELRQKTSTETIPIILLTARADEETKLAALAAGASDFLTKPFSSTELHIRLENLVQSHLLQRKLANQNQILESTLEQLKDTEIQLVQTEKLASLGRMSAGIIHEINNPLNYAKTGVYTLKKKGRLLPGEEKEEFDEILGDVEEGINRVHHIVSDLRSFTHPSADSVDQFAVRPAVDSALRFLSHEWRDQVNIINEVSEEAMLSGNRNQVIQVLVNLLQNAIDALKEKSFGEEKPRILIHVGQTRSKTHLIVRDNGPGIPSETVDKIFEPFFTTKDVGQGMGLGLSICYRIMEAHGGRILVTSELGQFCEFTLEFPTNPQESETVGT